MKTWVEKSWMFQQDKFKIFRAREFDEVPNEELKEKLACVFKICYGDKCMTKDRKKQLDKIYKNITGSNGHSNQLFSHVYINLKMKDTHEKELVLCVFGIGNIFVDMDGRQYNSWNDFLDNNLLPECYLIYPKNGRYGTSYIKDYAEIEVYISAAGREERKGKRALDSLMAFGSCAALGVLLFNPVSAPITIGASITAVATGAYKACNAVANVCDIANREGLDLTELRSSLAVANAVVSVAGTTAIGASSVCKLLRNSNKLMRFSVVTTIAENAETITRIVCLSTSAVGMIYNIIEEARNWNQNSKSLPERLQNCLFLFYNIVVSSYVASQFIACMLSSVYLRNVIIKEAPTIYKKIRQLITVDNLSELLKLITTKVDNVIQIVSNNSSVKQVSTAVETFVNKLPSDRIQKVIYAITALPKVIDAVGLALCSARDEVTDQCDTRKMQEVRALTMKRNKISGSLNEVIDEIKTPIIIRNIVKETLKKMNTDENNLISKETQLLDKIMDLVLNDIDIDEIPHHLYLVNKVNCYCSLFESTYTKMRDLYEYEYFVANIKDKILSRELFFRFTLEIPGTIVNFVFNESLSLLEQCSRNFVYVGSSKTDESKKNIFVFEEEMLGCLDEDTCLNICKKHLPMGFLKDCDSSCSFDIISNNAAIGKCFEREFFIATTLKDYKTVGVIIFN